MSLDIEPPEQDSTAEDFPLSSAARWAIGGIGGMLGPYATMGAMLALAPQWVRNSLISLVLPVAVGSLCVWMLPLTTNERGGCLLAYIPVMSIVVFAQAVSYICNVFGACF